MMSWQKIFEYPDVGMFLTALRVYAEFQTPYYPYDEVSLFRMSPSLARLYFPLDLYQFSTPFNKLFNLPGGLLYYHFNNFAVAKPVPAMSVSSICFSKLSVHT